MPVAIAVRTRLFARLRELARGTETEALELPAGSNLADAYEALRLRHPALPDRGAVRAALNQEFSDWTTKVADGDEVAFIPPVSGGAHGVGDGDRARLHAGALYSPDARIAAWQTSYSIPC